MRRFAESGFDQTKIFTNDIYFWYLYVGLISILTSTKKLVNDTDTSGMGKDSKLFMLSDMNTLRPRQDGHRFPDDTFERIFLTENVIILIKISMKFVPDGSIDNIPVLVRRPGDKPLSEPMMIRLPTHICVTRSQWVNTLGSGEIVAVLPIFEMYFLKWKLPLCHSK